MNTAAYLERIAYSGPTAPSAETLRQLHRAHLFAVPFENLDIARKRKIVVDPETCVRKVVEEHRGGFCYELNGAFAALLSALGFRVTLLSARVPREDGSDSPEFDHLTLRVDLEEPWLADVGFGDSFLEPLKLEVGLEQTQGERTFRIVQNAEPLRVERDEGAANWRIEYAFTLRPRRIEDFAAMCHFHQTSPQSPFTRKRVCSLAVPGGRITLAEMNLIITQDGKRSERVLASEQERLDTLKHEFGIVF